jgi:Uma2 family endonuclease
LSWKHGGKENEVGTWLGVYKAATPGCDAANNATWLMGIHDAPQPDLSLRILSDFGGQSHMQGEYAAGAAEFLAEICLSSTAYDLHQKLELYEHAGVQEYLAVLMHEREIRWHRLMEGRFHVIPASSDGIYRSASFPGLWLDGAALLAGDLARVLAVLQQGLQSPEHAEFVKQLQGRKQSA